MTLETADNGARRALPWRLSGWGGGALFLLLPIAVGAP
jgi:hypothetical protein